MSHLQKNGSIAQYYPTDLIWIRSPYQVSVQDKFFARMLVLSIVCHILLTIVAIVPKGSSLGGKDVSFVDLTFEAAPDKTSPRVNRKPLAPQNTIPRAQTATPEMTIPGEIAPSDSKDEVPPATAAIKDSIEKSLERANEQPEILHETSIGLGLTFGYFRSLKEGETLRSDIREYYFTMLRKVNENWWILGGAQGGTSAHAHEAIVDVVITREGTLLSSRFVQKTGNSTYDERIMKAIELTNPFPTLPDSYESEVFKAPLRIVMPMNLTIFGR